ncbi:MAG TPA: hypothetical protein VMS77_01570, partial [Conexivisphaerales archaeon]|nr:hypothetical protein [Conexivisphaerales archaeon]
MSHKAFGWARGAKKMEREFLDLRASDGTQECDGCGEVVPKGETIEEEHVYIVSSKGKNEWENFHLCSDCSVRMFEMTKRSGRGSRPAEARQEPEILDLNDRWDILRWELDRAKDAMSRQAELEDQPSSIKEYESQVGLATEKVKEALAGLEKLSRWRMVEVANQSKSKAESNP